MSIHWCKVLSLQGNLLIPDDWKWLYLSPIWFIFLTKLSSFIILPWSGVLNESLQSVKFASYFTWTCRLLFFGKKGPKVPKFDVLCVLFKHSNFCSRMQEMHSKRPRFQMFFSQVTCIVGARKLDQWCEFFPSLVLQSFFYLLKTLLKTLPDVSTVLHQSWSFHNNRVLLMLWYFRQTACRHLKRTEITGRSTLILFNSMCEGTAWNVSSHLS